MGVDTTVTSQIEAGMGPSDRRRTDVGLHLDPRRIRQVLFGVVLALTLGHMVFVVPQIGLGHLFDLDRESGPGTWVSTTLFTFGALASLLVATRVGTGRRRRGLLGMALVLLALGAEEVMAFHESASLEIATAADLAGADSGGTPYMGYALLPALALGTWLVARRCTRTAAIGLGIGVGVWFTATFVTEQLDAWNLAVAPEHLDSALLIHRIITGFQEGGEMLGVAIVIVALLQELEALGGIWIDVSPSRAPGRSASTRAR